MGEDDAFFPTGTAVADRDWVDPNLGLEDGAGNRAAGKGDRFVTQVVAVYSRVVGD